MTEVQLAYGSRGLRLDLPSAATSVIEPTYVPAARDERAELRRALRDPLGMPGRLRELVERGSRVAISVCDVTRPQPRQLMVEAILDELGGVVPPNDVTILIATGTHRANTPAELEAMLGPQVLADCKVVNHDARDEPSLVYLGRMGAGVPVLLNREWLDADIRVTTGFVEPHFFAGFSGGPKMVAPGLAGLETVLTLHDARRISHPKATWAVCEGNPVHDDIRAIAAATGVDFAVDVVLNREQKITAAFAGALLPMHAAAREVARGVAMQPVKQRFDVVVTTNAGHPLDQNLYQSVKGMSAAANVVKPGGLIICAAECRDGMPNHGNYAELLRSAASPGELLRSLSASRSTQPDQWQVMIQARVQQHARVVVKADGLTDEQLTDAHLQPCHDVAATVETELRRVGPNATVCVLPEGPLTVPYVSS